MVKQTTNESLRRGPPRQTRIKKQFEKEEREEDEEDIYEDSQSLHDDDSESDMDESSQEESEEESEESEREPAVKQMQFRQKRGTKMNYLINRKKQEQEDPFWAGQGGQFFGNLDDGDNDEQDYVQSSSGRDQFDSDFDQTQSEHEIESPVEEKDEDEERKNQRRKRQEMMRKVKIPLQSKKSSIGEKSQQDKKQAIEGSNRFIHQMFSQQELLGEAATTEYFNWLSLKKLISLETEKKEFARRSHHLEGPKIIYRDRFGAEGVREQTYELVDTKVAKLSDLTRLMHSS